MDSSRRRLWWALGVVALLCAAYSGYLFVAWQNAKRLNGDPDPQVGRFIEQQPDGSWCVVVVDGVPKLEMDWLGRAKRGPYLDWKDVGFRSLVDNEFVDHGYTGPMLPGQRICDLAEPYHEWVYLPEDLIITYSRP